METLLAFIKDHAYLILFITTTAEGPIASFVSGGIAAQGLLRLEYVFLITLAGDILSDIWLYIIGRFLHRITRLRRHHEHFTEKKVFNKLYTRYPFFYFLIVKITPYLSAPSLMTAGMKKMNIFKFIWYSLLISIIVKMVYVGIWYLWSVTIGQLENFLHRRKIAVAYLIGGIILFQIIKRCYKRISTVLIEKMKQRTEKMKQRTER